jgi:hypothetical protein
MKPNPNRASGKTSHGVWRGLTALNRTPLVVELIKSLLNTCSLTLEIPVSLSFGVALFPHVSLGMVIPLAHVILQPFSINIATGSIYS